MIPGHGCQDLIETAHNLRTRSGGLSDQARLPSAAAAALGRPGSGWWGWAGEGGLREAPKSAQTKIYHYLPLIAPAFWSCVKPVHKRVGRWARALLPVVHKRVGQCGRCYL